MNEIKSFFVLYPCRTLSAESTGHFGQTRHCLCGWEPTCRCHHHAEPCTCSCHLEKVRLSIFSETRHIWMWRIVCRENKTGSNAPACTITCKLVTEVVHECVVLNLCLNSETVSDLLLISNKESLAEEVSREPEHCWFSSHFYSHQGLFYKLE